VINAYAQNLQQVMLDKESSGDYAAVNDLGYAGGYQFGAQALETLGYLKAGSSKTGNKTAMSDPANWTGKGNITSLDQFLSNPDAQDTVFQENIDFNLNALKQKGTVTDDTPPADVSGLLAASHLLGAGGASNLDSVDANGTSGNDYFQLGASAYNSSAQPGAVDAVADFTATQQAAAPQVAAQQTSTPQVAAPQAAALPQDAVQSFLRPARAQDDTVLAQAYNTGSPQSSYVTNAAIDTSSPMGLTAEMINSGSVPELGGLPSYDLVEDFQRGVTSGMESLAADINYMGAAIDVLQGDESGVADSIANARIREEFAAIPMEGIQAFGEFLDEPTIGGFFTQVASGTGQLVPSVISTISGAGVGSIAMLTGKQALTQSSRAAAKNIIKDSLVAVSKNTATPTQSDIAQAAFEATKEAHVLARNGFLRKKTRNQGALLGAGTSEYVPLAGSNVSETLESGNELDQRAAVRAGLVALPQAAVGLFGEVGLLKLLSKQAQSKSAGPNSVMGRLAKTLGTQFGKGGLIEGSTELVQEEISIRNRMDMDDTFTDADANLRRLNAGFVGFFGGGAVAGGGSLALQGASEVLNRNVIGDVASVAEKAAEMTDSIKEFMTRNKAALEISVTAPGQTTEESARDIDAQLAAMIDDTSSKEAVWVSGTEPDSRVKGAKPNRIRRVEVNGKEAFAAFISGRGTIISTSYDVVQNVIKGQASDAVLAAALGYSNTKSDTDTHVVKVVDKYGDVVSEESTNPAGVVAALAAAQKIMPEGGSVTTVTTEEALAQRTQRNGPEVKMMEDDEGGDPLAEGQNSNEEFGDGEFESEIRSHSFINKDGEQVESYQAIEGDNDFDGITEARAAYADVVGEDIDWSTPFYKRMSKSALNTATKLQQASPDEVVNIQVNKDGSYRIEIETTPDTQKIRIRDGKGGDDEVSMSEFLRRSITKALGSRPEFRTISITMPGSEKPVSVNPVDLMNAGRRIVEATGGSFTGAGAQQSSRQGLLAMLGQLQMAGYEIEVQGVPLAIVLENLANPNVELPPKLAGITVGFNEAGKKITLGQLLKPYVPGAPTVTNLIEVDDGNGGVRLSSVENEANIGSDSDQVLTDSIEMIESSARTPDGIPLTDMNIADLTNTDTTQNRPIGSAPQTNTDADAPRPQVDFKTGTTFPFGDVNSLVSSIASRISRRLKLKNPIAVISLKGFNQATRDQISSYIIGKKSAKGKIALKKLETLDLGDNVAVGKFIQQLQADGLLAKNISKHVAKVEDTTLLGQSLVMRAAVDILRTQTTSVRIAEQIAANLVDSFGNPKRKGYFTGYSNGSIIMVNDLHNQNEAAMALTVAHEMGHALFKEEINGLLANKPLYNRMYAAFIRDRNKARAEGKPIKQWENEGFEEWYADQVAAWAKNDNQTDKRGAKDAVDSHFKRVVAKFKQLWSEMKNHPSQAYRRFNTLKPTFAKYMAGVTTARKSNKTTTTIPVTNEAGDVVAYRSALGGIVDDSGYAGEENDVALANALPKEEAETARPEPAVVPTEPSFEQRAIVREVREQIRMQSGAPAREAAWNRKMKSWSQLFSKEFPNATKVLGLLRTADGMLRMVAGERVADLFYVESNSRTGTGLGFVRARQLAQDRLRADLFKVLGKDWTTEEVQAALRAAQSSTPTAELTNTKAKEIREFLEKVHNDYIVPSNTNIGFRENYYPVLLSIGEIANNPNGFIDLTLQNDPTADKKKVQRAVKNLVLYQKAIDGEPAPNKDKDADEDAQTLEPGAAAEASMKLTANVDVDILRANGFLQEPEVALMSYLDNIAKRVEWNRHMVAEDGTNILQEELADLTPEQREIAESVIQSYLGNVPHLPPFWRKAQSYVQALNLVTLLPFAAFASIPDFAGSVAQTREFSGFAMFGKQVVATIKDRGAAQRLAYDIGVVMPEAAANAWMSQADSDMLDPKVRMATDKFFRYTGLSGLTTLSREFASGMGKQFIIEHANHPTKRSERYLTELGLTADQVKAWQENNYSFTGESGAAVREGLVRFVESSVLRPNAAERPIWASDPRFALIWQLKSFIYAFNKVILEGQSREFQARVVEGSGVVQSMAPLLLITMAAFMPLAALGLELREYAKVGLSYAIPWTDGSTKYLRSDRMDWGTYFVELFGRAGLDGPIGMLTMAQRSSDWGGSAVATLLGPTAELTEKLITDGPIDTAWSRVNSPPETVGAILGVGALIRAAL